jgi:hypothetical protein
MSPTRGLVTFGWEGPIVVDGQPHALDGYKRFDNPFVQVDFDTTRYEVEADGYSLLLDFATDTREAAPLGLNPRIKTAFLGACATPRFNSKGQVITSCLDAVSAEAGGGFQRLVLLDTDLNVLAETNEWTGADLGSEIGGGTYPHVLHDDSVINGTSGLLVERFEVVPEAGAASGLAWERTVLHDLSAFIPGDAFFDVVPDFDGTLWFATAGGGSIGGASIGFLDPFGVPRFLKLHGEKVENGLAVGEDGIFVLTDTALYRFERDPGTHMPIFTWRRTYDNEPGRKLGALSDGGGATPTLIGRDLIAVSDDAAGRVNVLIYQRRGGRLLCKVPVFADGLSAVDVSVIGHEQSILVGNWYGVDDPLPAGAGRTVPPIIGDMRRMAGGFTRVDLNEDRSGCDVRWTRPDIKHNTVPQLSTVTGLVYTYTQDTSVPEPVDAYYFEALDWRTGETVFRVLSGVGPYFYNGLLTSALGPGGGYYVALTGGIARLKDGGDYWVNYDRMRSLPGFRRKAARNSRRYSFTGMHEDDLPVTDCTQELLITALFQVYLGVPPDQHACDITGM